MADFAETIFTTGFPLEHKAATLFRARGWNVISNRFYLDDQSATVREIDLVAYRAKQCDEINAYTVALVSCKKNEKNAWALLSRSQIEKDPNVDRHPVHYWTNDLALKHMLTRTEWRPDYYKEQVGASSRPSLFEPTTDIFAYQEMNKESGKCCNDKAIFQAVTSLMKAQHYETSRPSSRRDEECVYQFNLISLVGTDIVEIFFDEDCKASENKVDIATLQTEYIVDKKNTRSNVFFSDEASFPSLVSDLEIIHETNCAFFENRRNRFFASLTDHPSRWETFKPAFRKALATEFYGLLLHNGIGHRTPSDIRFRYDSVSENLDIEVVVEEGHIPNVTDPNFLEQVKKQLRFFYKYDGKCTVQVTDLPF